MRKTGLIRKSKGPGGWAIDHDRMESKLAAMTAFPSESLAVEVDGQMQKVRLVSATARPGVSAEDFERALRIILERRRVSYDLLRSQIGSSCRAAILLSLLEANGAISRCRETGWQIHFDRIEDCLRVYFPETKDRFMAHTAIKRRG